MSMKYAGHDTSLAGSFQLQLPKGTLKCQFPPKVQSDGRSGTWKEWETRGQEPIASFVTAGPRIFNILVTYIVDGSAWTSSTIAQQLQLLRGYFMVPMTASDDKLVCHLKCWKIGGGSAMTCRLKDVNVKYSNTLVGDGDDAFPLKTDVTIDLRLWSKGGGQGEKLQEVKGLDGVTPPDWY